MTLLRTENLSKSFSGVRVLDSISFALDSGESLGLLGENGAGKSTLMKILSGVWAKGTYSGEFYIQGEKASFNSPRDALEKGIFIVHQELSVFENLSVAENLFMGQLPHQVGFVKAEEINQQTKRLLDQVGLYHIRPEQSLVELRTGEKQLVEIARALRIKAKLMIFDEPTSALSDREIKRLFLLIDELREQGIACIVISHKLDEVRRLCDRVVVLRDGQFIRDSKMDETTDDDLIRSMVGRELSDIYPEKVSQKESGAFALEVENLSYQPGPTGRPLLKNISFQLQKAEILGIGGLLGAGRSELLLALFGALEAKKNSGTVKLFGELLSLASPQDAIDKGLGLVTEDRKLTGAFLNLSLSENILLPNLRAYTSWGFLNEQKEETEALTQLNDLGIRCQGASQPIATLSGGNQQKALLARWLARKVKVLLLDEPTRGIDVGAKSEVYRLLRNLSQSGVSILLVSSEMPELIGVCDRVLMMREGLISGELTGDRISEENMMALAAGIK